MAQPTGFTFETRTAVYNIGLTLNPISGEAPDAGGGGSPKEVLDTVGILGGALSQQRLQSKASYQPRAATFPPGEADSPSLLEVAAAAGRRSARQRPQLSQGAGMAGAARPSAAEGSLRASRRW